MIFFREVYVFKAIELNSRKTVNDGDGKELDKEARVLALKNSNMTQESRLRKIV